MRYYPSSLSGLESPGFSRGEEVKSLLMVAMIGVFPLSVIVAGYGVNAAGPGPFFLVAGALIAVASTAGLTQRAYRRHAMGDRFTGAAEGVTAEA